MSNILIKKSHGLKPLPLAIALAAFTTGASAAFDIKIESNGQNQPFQTFSINIQSDIELKFVEYFSYPAQYCDARFLPYQPQSVSGTEFSTQAHYNYGQHRYTNGDNICLFVEDQQGNQQVFSSADTVALAAPEFFISQVSANDISHLVFNRNNEQGAFVNRADFVFREESAGKSVQFHLTGQASLDTVMQIKTYNGIVAASSPVDSNGHWNINNFNLDLPSDSVSAGRSYYLTSVLAADTSVELARERLSIRGEKVFIDLLSQPLDPIDESQYDSATLRWDLRSPISIRHSRMFIVDGPEYCPRDGEVNADQGLEISGTSFNFFQHRDFIGGFACLQLEDDQGRLFNQSAGWARNQPLPEIIVSDDISDQAGYSDTFISYITGAEQVRVRYLSDLGSQSREHMWQTCQLTAGGISGTHLDPQQQLLELSDPSLHDRYLCLSADNGFGGVTHWMSENKLNLMGGNSIVRNLQPRGQSTALPTALEIPPALQGSTIANAGCRGVLLSEDVILTAGHCQAPFFHPPNGTWAFAPDKYGFLAAADEAENRIAEVMERELYERLNNDPDYTYPQFRADRARIAEQYSQYHSSAYHTWFSPDFGPGRSSDRTFADVALRRLTTPYTNPTGTVEYPQPLVYSHPSELHLSKGEYRSHGIHELTPHSGWRGGDIHVLSAPGTSITEYTLVETSGGESGSALWAYDQILEEYGVIGSVRGGGAWSSLWSHGRVTRQELADSRLRQLQSRRDAYQGELFDYRDLRRAVASADIALINNIIDSGVDVNRDGNNTLDGWMLARAIDFAAQAKIKLEQRNNSKHQELFEQRVAVIKALMLGGADPRLNVAKPTRYMSIAAGDSVLHYAVRENNSAMFKALWLNTTDYAFESSARTQVNLSGETPLSIASAQDSQYAIIKMLFADVGDDLQLSNEGNLLDQLVTADTLSDSQIEIIDWIAKAYLYEPVDIPNNGDISSDNWKILLCHSVDFQGSAYSFNELAQLRRDEVGERATAAIAALGNIAGVDASAYHCLK